MPAIEGKPVKTAMFVGLITLDCIYATQKPLEPNEKQVARSMLIAAGGPATNAAVAFRALGNRTKLVGALGNHPLCTVIRDDLRQHRVDLVDLTPTATVPPPLSSILVNTLTGDRAVISRNAVDRPHPQSPYPPELLDNMDCILIDGHQMSLGANIGQQARSKDIPIVIDAGSWKTGFEEVLSLAKVVIASSVFCPPGHGSGQSAIAYLASLGIPYIAVTRGDQPILYQTPTQAGELAVPNIQPVDTLGAGDIFHGAFCHSYSQGIAFQTALEQAAQVAAQACQVFGTRQWIQEPSP